MYITKCGTPFVSDKGKNAVLKNNTSPIVSKMRNAVIPLLFCVVDIAALGHKANVPLRKIYAAGKP
eukprot:11750680-Ditylum_brightwellii.AAC.1